LPPDLLATLSGVEFEITGPNYAWPPGTVCDDCDLDTGVVFMLENTFPGTAGCRYEMPEYMAVCGNYPPGAIACDACHVFGPVPGGCLIVPDQYDPPMPGNTFDPAGELVYGGPAIVRPRALCRDYGSGAESWRLFIPVRVHWLDGFQVRSRIAALFFDPPNEDIGDPTGIWTGRPNQPGDPYGSRGADQGLLDSLNLISPGIVTVTTP
jgi:hypothetical protein